MEGPEEELLRQVQAGDRAAFDRLRAVLEPPTRRFVRRLIGSSGAEEDILQDAFVALYVHRRRIDPPSNLRPYLFRIVRNLCYSELRRQGRFRTVSLDEPTTAEDVPLPALVDPRARPDDQAHWMLVYAEVQRAIRTLPEFQRQTLLLFCAEGLTHAEVALAMDTDAATVKSRLNLARRTLAKRLGADTLDAIGLREGRDARGR
ncbi:MAG TPA: sigma-70 family RNA polymerase sigma factor [Armatimonadota bacterium]|jgi:RNA polymerase sigma-70 factor (ECF subfamily)